MPPRILLARAHASNGLANRLAGLRGALRLAEESGRRLVVEWAAGGQEGNWLEPAPGVMWRMGAAPGVGPPSDLDNVGLRGEKAQELVTYFKKLARTERPLVVVSNLWHDLSFVPMSSANVTERNEEYARLLRPSAKLGVMIEDHVEELGLWERSSSWAGLQIRRSDNLAKSIDRYASHREAPLSLSEKAGLDRALRAAREKLEDESLFVTTNSGAVQRFLQKRVPGACMTANASHLEHSSPRRGGYLGPLLEFMVLASSGRIVGTAGSSFAAEAAYFGGVEQVMLGDWGTFLQLPKVARVRGTRLLPG